jgi:hypothetical protein
MPEPTESVRRVSLDITEISHSRRGRKVVNSLTTAQFEMFLTKRGRLGLILPADTYNKLRRRLEIEHEDGLDGLKLVRFAEAQTEGTHP